jgi:hypothetical protein
MSVENKQDGDNDGIEAIKDILNIDSNTQAFDEAKSSSSSDSGVLKIDPLYRLYEIDYSIINDACKKIRNFVPTWQCTS